MRVTSTFALVWALLSSTTHLIKQLSLFELKEYRQNRSWLPR